MGRRRVGEHLGVQAEGERVVTHLFACLDPAYAGWRWAVTVARAPRSKVVTVNETVLLPGAGRRCSRRTGCRGTTGCGRATWASGTCCPPRRTTSGSSRWSTLEGDDAVIDWFADGEDAGEQDAGPRSPAELPAPGRSRVLSAIGRESAAERWYASEHGPRTPLAHAAPAHCVSCGFFVPLSGELGRLFGACANAYAPDDGRVVSADHGCGAHSESVIWQAPGRAISPVIDEFGYDMVDLPGVSVEETVFEPLSRGAD